MTTATATHQPVVIRLSGRGELPAFIDSADAETLTLVLTTTPERTLRAEKVVVEFTTRRGVHRVSGQASTDSAHPEVLTLTRDGSGEVIQRRDYVRVDAVVAVSVSVTDGDGEVRTNTLNLSGGGMLIHDPHGFAVGTELSFEIHLRDDEAPVRASGKVVRETGDGSKGVQISSISERERERLIRWITERERRELQIAPRR